MTKMCDQRIDIPRLSQQLGEDPLGLAHVVLHSGPRDAASMLSRPKNGGALLEKC